MERADYRDNLAMVLEFFPDKRLLSIEDLRRFTGYKDARTIRRRYPLDSAGMISAATFARALCSEGPTRRK